MIDPNIAKTHYSLGWLQIKSCQAILCNATCTYLWNKYLETISYNIVGIAVKPIQNFPSKTKILKLYFQQIVVKPYIPHKSLLQ